MIGTINCVYETPCGWCSKWNKKCDTNIPSYPSDVNTKYITKQAMEELSSVLEKYEIPYTTRYASRDVTKSMAYPDTIVHDLHIQINVAVPDYLDEDK